MKYYLIIGYQLLQKHKTYPTIRLSINDNFISEFDCDNQKTTQVTTTHHETRGVFYPEVSDDAQFKSNITQEKTFTLPCKFKTFELDSESWHDNSKLRIDISNNNSDYANGFMGKKSLVGFRPIYLIPKMICDNEKKIIKLAKNACNICSAYFYKNSNSKRWTWPGLYDIDSYSEYFGGNTKLVLNIKKKQNFFILTPDGSQNLSMVGLPQISRFFFAWMNAYWGKSYQIKEARTTTIDGNSPHREKHSIDVLEQLYDAK